jgi:L-idonate 5-dehydrogenase
MRALMIHAPHDLRIEPFPELAGDPGPGEVRVRMAAGGMCGSDLHYYHDGGFGTVRIRQPMALGHEAAGRITAIGADVTGLSIGELVAVNPSVPCRTCANCRAGHSVQCTDMRFNGSAMRFPHVQGLFREEMTITADRAFGMPAEVSPAEAALCEPFAVALHAVSQAGDVAGRSVFVSGAGPIGVLVAAAARLKGAARIVATDITPHALAMATRFGATEAIDVSAGPGALAHLEADRGQMDVAFECSGNGKALAAAIGVLKPRGRMVLVGLGGEAALPTNAVVTKELELAGTFRFDAEFAEAARLIAGRAVDLSGVITQSYPLAEAVTAFAHASEKSRATKVTILLDGEG